MFIAEKKEPMKEISFTGLVTEQTAHQMTMNIQSGLDKCLCLGVMGDYEGLQVHVSGIEIDDFQNQHLKVMCIPTVRVLC